MEHTHQVAAHDLSNLCDWLNGYADGAIVVQCMICRDNITIRGI